MSTQTRVESGGRLWYNNKEEVDGVAKVANCFVAAHYLVTAAYPSTPHSSKCARLAFDDFCLAIHEIDFLRVRQEVGRLLW
ncbi:MAG: hypothetical protein ACOY32_12730 [Thermodesulfobacteriota bacterium]